MLCLAGAKAWSVLHETVALCPSRCQGPCRPPCMAGYNWSISERPVLWLLCFLCVFCLPTPDQTPPLSLPPALAFRAHVFGGILSLLPKGNLLCCNELDSGQGGDGWMLKHGVGRDQRHAPGACEDSRCSPRPTES